MAGYSPDGKNLALGAFTTAARWLTLHSADPGTTGASEMAGTGAARAQTTWGAPDGDSMTGSAVDIGVPAGGPYTHWGLYTTGPAVGGGSYITGGALDAPESYGAPGIYTLTPTLTA
ncbi:MAG: Phage protein [Mycobacterium sp.]|jgi:hypothetical protein|nr:Phage protein [Mycobacterium sp.]